MDKKVGPAAVLSVIHSLNAWTKDTRKCKCSQMHTSAFCLYSQSTYCCMQYAYNWDILLCRSGLWTLTLILLHPAQPYCEILECKGKVHNSEHTLSLYSCDTCDVLSAAQRIVGQNGKKSMLACLLQNTPGCSKVEHPGTSVIPDVLHIGTY